MTGTLWISVLIATGSSILFTTIFTFITLKRMRNRLQKSYDEETDYLQKAIISELTQELKKYKEDTQKEHFREWEAFKKEMLKKVDFEIELIKSRLNTQPSYPKKLEAQQKLAVLINTIHSSMEGGETNFQEWESAIQQYLLNYAGIINENTSALLSSALDFCSSFSGENILHCLQKAKHQLKETALVKS
jgi:hypothetical protein